MTGTLGSYSVSSGGVMLPAPKLQLYTLGTPQPFDIVDRSPSNTTAGGAVIRQVKVTVPGLPSAILDDLAVYQPKVELMRFTRLNSRNSASGGIGAGNKSSGYVHPSHGPGASGNGSFTHGGLHGGVAPNVQAIRPTEWDILASNSWIDVTQGMMGFMCLTQIEYRDNAGGVQLTDVLVPSHALNRRAKMGRRYPYARIFTPGYFEFRVSVRDLSDARGKRIHGPTSSRIACTNNIFPFLPAGVDANGKAQTTLDPRHDPKTANFWIGSASRLPAQ